MKNESLLDVGRKGMNQVAGWGLVHFMKEMIYYTC